MASHDSSDLKPQAHSTNPLSLIPLGVWIRVDLPGLFSIVGFTYVDSQAGLSAQGWKVDGSVLDQKSRTTLRLPMPGMAWQQLDGDEVRTLGLDSPPSWVAEFYGPQP